MTSNKNLSQSAPDIEGFETSRPQGVSAMQNLSEMLRLKNIAIPIGTGLTMVSIVFGFTSMAKNMGRHQATAMRLRVGFQGATVVALIVVAFGATNEKLARSRAARLEETERRNALAAVKKSKLAASLAE